MPPLTRTKTGPNINANSLVSSFMFMFVTYLGVYIYTPNWQADMSFYVLPSPKGMAVILNVLQESNCGIDRFRWFSQNRHVDGYCLGSLSARDGTGANRSMSPESREGREPFHAE